MTKQQNKTCLITGSTSGIGYATADGLLKAGHRVLLLGRSEERLVQTYRSLKKLYPSGEIKTILCDLSSLTSIREA